MGVENDHSIFGNEEKSNIDVRQPFQIIRMAEDNASFVLEENNLKIVMREVTKLERYATQLVVISVVGAFRTGKSFLLSTFIRYLEYCEETRKEIPAVKPGGAEWLLSKKILSAGHIKSDAAEPGFAWAAGKDRTTTGMWMYGKPFLRTIPGTTDKAIVLLMDTQGMFDMKTSKEVTAAIFGLSTLISSYQILNLKHQIQENALQELHFFSQYSLAALRQLKEKEEISDAAPNKDNEMKSNEKTAPFQMLEFLIRDYQNFEDEDNIDESLKEAGPYLEGVFRSRDHDDGMRDQITNTFQKMKCFLLSFPGNSMTAKKWDGNLDKVEKSFIYLLDHYIRQVFEKNLVVKKIQGQTITAGRLENFLKAFIEIFKDGKMPQAKGLVQAIGDATNICAKDDALSLYSETMNTLCDSFLKDSEFKEADKKSKDLAFDLYDTTAGFGDQEKSKKIRQDLEVTLKQLFKEFRSKNERKMHANMEKYVLPVFAAIVAYLLDWASDYLCDRWLSTCQQFSKLAFLFYFVIFLVIFIELGRIYRNCGIATTGIVATSFGGSLIDRAKTINDVRVQPFLKRFQNTSEKPHND